MKRIVRILFAIIWVPLFGLQAQTDKSAEITAKELKAHLKYLASDDLEGRRTGSKGADAAAEYIAREFKTYGLAPAGTNNSFIQPFEFVSDVTLADGNSITVTTGGVKHSFVVDTDVRPLGFSTSGSVAGQVVFAGYGITAEEKSYDDYAGIDVKGKIVMMLRYNPDPDNQHSEFARYSAIRYKASKAKEMGASGIILVTGPVDADEDNLMKLAFDNSMGNAGIVAVNLTRTAADRILASSGFTIASLQDSINSTLSPRSFELKGTHVDLSVQLMEIRKTGRNVVGMLEGSDPALKNEIVVVGAHYDHLGWGGPGSGSLFPDTIAIHNGADDNGSGTVGLLELAQYFASTRSQLRRSMLFIAFSGEELGLLGSGYFVAHPTVTLDNIVTMVNMDMIGRLHDRKLIVYGTGTSPGFEELATKHNADSTFDLRLVKDGFGPSDQSSFYGKNIPVFHFFTDLHSDYHRPSDDYDLINYEGMESVLKYVRAILVDLEKQESRPQYARVEAERPQAGSGRGIRSYTGTIPDFGEQVEGMKISGVREGSPAANAGMQGGDIIIKFGRIEIKNLYDYTYALGEYKPGDEVEVQVKRGDEILKLQLTVGKRN